MLLILLYFERKNKSWLLICRLMNKPTYYPKSQTISFFDQIYKYTIIYDTVNYEIYILYQDQI